MSVGSRVYDDAVDLIKIGLPYGIHQIALMVGLYKTHFYALFLRMKAYHIHQILIGGFTVNVGLTYAQKI